MRAPARHGTPPKHSSAKHAVRRSASAKHAPVTAAKAPAPGTGKPPVPGKPARARRLTPDEGVALCSARAVAESLRLALGIRASDDDVLDLYFRTADDPDEGASILATLHAAATFGLAGAVPEYRRGSRPAGSAPPGTSVALILGLELPEGPHAVLATEDGWWSWGELHDPGAFPGAVVEEAWPVRWAA